MISPPGKLPTAQRESVGDVVIKVIEQSQPKPQQMESSGPMIATPWQQFRADADINRPLTVAFCYVVVLYSRQSKEAWICDITSTSPNTLVVVSSLSSNLKLIVLVWHPIQTLRSVI